MGRSVAAEIPGSARVPRAGCGVSPQRTFGTFRVSESAENKVRAGGTPAPARETRALPSLRPCARLSPE